jgi:hypothetical protein
MNTANKLITFFIVLISGVIGKQNSLVFWSVLSILGIIPAIFVKEDFRRLNMKEVEKSMYIEEQKLLDKTVEERQEIYRN